MLKSGAHIEYLRTMVYGKALRQFDTLYAEAQKEIICCMLTYNYGNLPLPFICGNFNGNFARFYYKTTLHCFQIMTKNSHLG